MMDNANILIGKRIKLIRMDDKFTDLKYGDEGTVTHVDGIGQIHMQWDNGSTLAIVPSIDEYEVLNESNRGRISKPVATTGRRVMLFESYNLTMSVDKLKNTITKINSLVLHSFITFKSEINGYDARLELSYVDEENDEYSQGVIYEVDLELNSVMKLSYTKSTNPNDMDEDPIESHFPRVEDLLEYLYTEIVNYIKIEESKRYKNI